MRGLGWKWIWVRPCFCRQRQIIGSEAGKGRAKRQAEVYPGTTQVGMLPLREKQTVILFRRRRCSLR